MSLELRIELRMLGLMKAIVENPALNKETVLKQIGDAEHIATIKMREIEEKRGRSSIEEEELILIQSNDQIQNRVNQNMSTNF
jgi:hypothetical protein